MSQPFHFYDSLLDHFRQILSGPDSQLVNLALWIWPVQSPELSSLSGG